MKIWKDREGNWLTPKEFFSRWSQGIKEVAMKSTPQQQLKGQIRFTWIIVIGLLAGFVISLIQWRELWWLAIILFGALGNTGIQLIAFKQKQKMLSGFTEMFSFGKTEGENEN